MVELVTNVHDYSMVLPGQSAGYGFRRIQASSRCRDRGFGLTEPGPDRPMDVGQVGKQDRRRRRNAHINEVRLNGSRLVTMVSVYI